MSASRARRRHLDREPAGEPRITVTAPGAQVPPRLYPPGAHPGSDELTVIWPDVRVPAGLDGQALDEYLESLPPGAVQVRADEVTRDEFTRRMAGLDVVRQVNADPRNRVVALMEPEAIMRWAEGRAP